MSTLIQIKSKITRKEGHAYLRPNCCQKFHGSDKMKQRKDRHYQMKTCRELLQCVPFSSFPVKGSHFTMFFSIL